MGVGRGVGGVPPHSRHPALARCSWRRWQWEGEAQGVGEGGRAGAPPLRQGGQGVESAHGEEGGDRRAWAGGRQPTSMLQRCWREAPPCAPTPVCVGEGLGHLNRHRQWLAGALLLLLLLVGVVGWVVGVLHPWLVLVVV